MAATSLLAPAVMAQRPVICADVNACRNQSECATASNNCRHRNACKGRGWLWMASKHECVVQSGRVL
jgi:hypothetical protein